MPVLIEEKKIYQLIREDGKRLDGRALDELRPFSCKIGVLHNADGSAYVEHGGNKIYAGVYGPREVHPRHLSNPDKGILQVVYRMATYSVHDRKSPAPNRREREISMVISQAIEPILFLELYPDSAIEVFVEVIAADGGTRCACTTAAVLALADAGIPMKTLVCGVASGKMNGKIALDLGDAEDKAGDADIPAAVQMSDGKINLLQFDGEMTPEELEEGFKLISKGAKEIFATMVEAIKSKFKKIQDEALIKNNELKAEMEKKKAETEKNKAETEKNKAETEKNKPKAEESTKVEATGDSPTSKKKETKEKAPTKPAITPAVTEATPSVKTEEKKVEAKKTEEKPKAVPEPKKEGEK